MSKAKQCKCGGERFSAEVKETHMCVVKGDGHWFHNEGIIIRGRPTGPFICHRCEKSYKSIKDIGK